MGCDVHANIEFEEWPGKERPWLEFAELHLWRNYRVFGYMAGIRGAGPAVTEPRGFPPDIYAEPTGDHTPSWLATWEFRQALEKAEAEFPGVSSDYWAALLAMEEIERRGKRCRLVFNFDS